MKFNGKELYAFWTPQTLNNASEKELRDLKLGYRAKFLKRIAKDFAENKVDEEAIKKLSKEEAKKELLKICGVGPASVNCILFEVFRHFDAFDTLPPWEQKILSRLIYKKQLVPAKKILEDAEKRWGEWKKISRPLRLGGYFLAKKKGRKIPWLEKEIRL